jgi:alkylation response protein AidB-like acyl-CoA dehydrogenase
VALGIAQGAYEHALAYAAARRQFGRAIGEFQGIRCKLATWPSSSTPRAC